MSVLHVNSSFWILQVKASLERLQKAYSTLISKHNKALEETEAISKDAKKHESSRADSITAVSKMEVRKDELERAIKDSQYEYECHETCLSELKQDVTQYREEYEQLNIAVKQLKVSLMQHFFYSRERAACCRCCA